MSLIHNTSYKTKIDDITDDELSNCNIENGAVVRTATGIYCGHGGENVRIYPQIGSSVDVEVNNITFNGGVTRNVTTITTGRTLTETDHIVFVNFNSEQNITLPSASANEGKEYVIRTRHNSSKAVVQRSGSDIIDDGGSETSIDVNGDKARTLISDGVSRWYCVTGIGS